MFTASSTGSGPDTASSADASAALSGIRLDNNELSAFCSQMGRLLKAGISYSEGLSILEKDASSEAERALLGSVRDQVDLGSSLAAALRKTGVFPMYMCQMVLLGEQTGSLDTIMVSLSSHYRREELIRTNIRNALVYPLVMAGMTLVVIILLLVLVLPIFAQVFEELGSGLTGLPLVLLNIGTGLRRYAAVFAVLLIVLFALVLFCLRNEKGRQWLSGLGSHFRGIRERRRLVALSRFAGTMALTLRSGLYPDECLAMARRLNEDEAFGGKLEKVQQGLEEGGSLAPLLEENGIFTGLYARMAAIGHKTGTLDQVMEEIAEMSRESLDTSLSRSLAVMEPVLVIVLSVLVGVILLSVMFPLLGIMSSM